MTYVTKCAPNDSIEGAPNSSSVVMEWASTGVSGYGQISGGNFSDILRFFEADSLDRCSTSIS